MRFFYVLLIPLLIGCGANPKQYDDTERPEEQLPKRVEQEFYTEPIKGSYRSYTVSIVRVDGCQYVLVMHNEGMGLIHHEMCDNPEHVNLEE